jgi:hypothetical protein
MHTYPRSIEPVEYRIESLFSLHLTQKTSSTRIILQSLNEYVNTSHISSIASLLSKHLPTVLLTTCYNDDNLPFSTEVRNTEIGHLFEHILLEYLCQLKIAKGANRAVFHGRTRWNWEKDPWGKFYIRLNCGIKDADILPLALKKTIELMKLILQDTTPVLPISSNPYNGLKNGQQTK